MSGSVYDKPGGRKTAGRSSAESSTSGGLVAAMMMIPVVPFQANHFQEQLVQGSFPFIVPPRCGTACRPTASNFSMKIRQGCFLGAFEVATRLAPTPTNSPTKSEPESREEGKPASPRDALAKSVLPVPGGPPTEGHGGVAPPR